MSVDNRIKTRLKVFTKEWGEFVDSLKEEELREKAYTDLIILFLGFAQNKYNAKVYDIQAKNWPKLLDKLSEEQTQPNGNTLKSNLVVPKQGHQIHPKVLAEMQKRKLQQNL